MIESKNDTSKNLEKALQALKQAQQRVANEKKKQNEKKRKAEVTYPPCLQGAHRYTTRGGMCALRGASFTCMDSCGGRCAKGRRTWGSYNPPSGRKCRPCPLVYFASRQKPKCGFYLPTKSIHAPHYSIGRM